MADVQEIMNNMEKVDNKVETSTIEPQQELANLVTTVVDPSINCEEPMPNVLLCCTTVVKNFTVTLANPLQNIKLIFDPTNLHATIEPCTVTVCGTPIGTHVIKAVGCIPFAFSIANAISAPCGRFSNDQATTHNTADLCSQCCVCVNNPICCYVDDIATGAINPLALEALDNLESDIKICTNIGVSNISAAIVRVDTNCNETFIRFTATLTLPNCRV